MVEPRDVRDDSRIVDLGPERREEDRRASADERARALPGPLAGKRVRKDGRLIDTSLAPRGTPKTS